MTPPHERPVAGVCTQCKFFVAWNALRGECRRFPPQGGETHFTELGEQRWPVMHPADWCGEWSSREVVKP